MHPLVQFVRLVGFLIWNSILFKTVHFFVSVIYKAFYFRNYPHVHDSYIFGNVIRVSPSFPFFDRSGTPLLNAVKYYTERFPRGFLIEWMFAYPVLIATDYELVYDILACKDNIDKGISYTFLEDAFMTGLLTSNGNKWRYRRRLIEPTMGIKMLVEFLPIMKKNAQLMIEELMAKRTQKINLADEVDRVALKVILQTAMGLSDEYLHDNIDEHVKTTRRVTSHIVHRIRNPTLWLTPYRKIYEKFTGIDKANRLFKEFSQRVIREKIKAKVDEINRSKVNQKQKKRQSIPEINQRKVFIDLLIDKYIESLSDDNPFKIDEDGLLEEVDLLVFAGFDTTATTIKWTLYCLGLDHKIQERLYQEVSSFDLHSEYFDKDYLKNFVYLDQVIKEGLRIRPTVPLVVRELGKDIHYKGYKFPKGTDALASIYSVHRDPEIYPEPDRFDPDRFSSENYVKIPSQAYIPFATGPRKCIGRSYAMLEMKILIASIVRNFKITAERPLNEIAYEINLVSTAKEPLIVSLTPRSSSDLYKPNLD